MSRWSVRELRSELAGFMLGPVSLDLSAGHAVAVLGRSGAGKTTLLRTIAGFAPARGGGIFCDGVDLTYTAPERRRIGFVPQGLGLFPHRTVEQNVRFPLEIRERPDARARTGKLLERFGLTGLRRRFPSQLSSGEAQKVALARALAAEPALLLWDEPAHALDVQARDDLVQLFHELEGAEAVPLLLVTHDPQLAFSLADQFALLNRGRVDFAGTAAEFVERPPDLFSARFAGFTNLFERASLDAPTGGPFVSWLRAAAGAEGVAFPSVVIRTASGASAWAGTLRRCRPRPDGWSVDLEVDGLSVVGSIPAGDATPPLTGAPVAFDLDRATLRALGPSLPPPGGPT